MSFRCPLTIYLVGFFFLNETNLQAFSLMKTWLHSGLEQPHLFLDHIKDQPEYALDIPSVSCLWGTCRHTSHIFLNNVYQLKSPTVDFMKESIHQSPLQLNAQSVLLEIGRLRFLTQNRQNHRYELENERKRLIGVASTKFQGELNSTLGPYLAARVGYTYGSEEQWDFILQSESHLQMEWQQAKVAIPLKQLWAGIQLKSRGRNSKNPSRSQWNIIWMNDSKPTFWLGGYLSKNLIENWMSAQIGGHWKWIFPKNIESYILETEFKTLPVFDKKRLFIWGRWSHLTQSWGVTIRPLDIFYISWIMGQTRQFFHSTDIFQGRSFRLFQIRWYLEF